MRPSQARRNVDFLKKLIKSEQDKRPPPSRFKGTSSPTDTGDEARTGSGSPAQYFRIRGVMQVLPTVTFGGAGGSAQPYVIEQDIQATFAGGRMLMKDTFSAGEFQKGLHEGILYGPEAGEGGETAGGDV